MDGHPPGRPPARPSRRAVCSAATAAVLVLGALAPAHPAAGAAPIVTDVAVTPVGAGDPVPIVVEAADADTVTASVVVGFGAEQDVALVDDGTGADALAGDGSWTGTIAGQPAGTLVRARATATNGDGDGVYPEPDDEARYRGAVVARPPVESALPVVDWYIADDHFTLLKTELGSKTYRPAVLLVDGVVYDGVRVRLQGGEITQAQNKKNYRFKMADGHDLVAPELSERPLEEFILDAEFDDALGVRTEIAWRLVDAAGGATIAHRKVRLERGNAFEGVYTFLEEYDDEWLEAEGKEDGLLYESEDMAWLHDVGPDEISDMWDQKEPEDAPHDALADLGAAVDGPASAAQVADLLERVDVAGLVNYYAIQAVLAAFDQIQHNIWLTHDPASGRWTPLHWDLDLTLGNPTEIVMRTPVTPSILNLASVIGREPRLAAMVQRRIRTIADIMWGPDGGEAWLDELLALLGPEMAADNTRWPKWRTPATDEAQIRSWLDARRQQIDVEWAVPGGVPSLPASGPVVISEIRATGAAAGDLVELANPGSTAVDVSGWTLSGAVTAVLPAGAVIPAGDRIVVPAAAAGPGASARGRLVVGSLGGPLPDGGGSLVLRDAGGVSQDTVAWQAGAPWPSAPGGRSIELLSLASDNALPASWAASSAIGGTPGAPRSTSGLAVTLWPDQSFAAPAAPVGMNVEVRNDGPGALTQVAISGPGSGCARTFARLEAGVSRLVRCTAPASSGPVGSFSTFRSTASAAGGVTAASGYVLVSTGGDEATFGPSTVLRELLHHPDGGLVASWDAPPTSPEVRSTHVLWSSPGRARPGSGATVAGDASTARVSPPVGDPVQMRVQSHRLLPGTITAASPAVTPRPSVYWPASSSGAWVDRALRIALRRAPTASERSAWVSALASGTSPAALLDEELARGRWAAQEAKVARLYAAFFDRAAETAGLQYWSARLAAGANISVVAESFARSPEFRATFGQGTHAAFVDLVYRNVLGRAPGAGDVEYWVGRINAGKTRGWVMAAFSESAEGKATLAPETDPVVISYALTGTSWTGQPFDDAVAWLRAGGTRRTVVEAARTDPASAQLSPPD
jgi:hypothetical protein